MTAIEYKILTKRAAEIANAGREHWEKIHQQELESQTQCDQRN